MIAARLGKPFEGAAVPAIYAAPILLFVFPPLTTVEAAATPWLLFGTLLTRVARAAGMARAGDPQLQALLRRRLLCACRRGLVVRVSPGDRTGHGGACSTPSSASSIWECRLPRDDWGSRSHRGGGLAQWSWPASSCCSNSPRTARGRRAVGMAFLLALLNAGLFIESAAGRLPALSIAGSALSWLVLGVWWGSAAGTVGLMPSLMVLVGLTLVMFAGYAWAHAEMLRHGEQRNEMLGFPTAASLEPGGPRLSSVRVPQPGMVEPAAAGTWGTAGHDAGSERDGALRQTGHHSRGSGDGQRRDRRRLGHPRAWAGVWICRARRCRSRDWYAVAWLWIARRLEDPATSIGALAAVLIGEVSLLGIAGATGPTIARAADDRARHQSVARASSGGGRGVSSTSAAVTVQADSGLLRDLGQRLTLTFPKPACHHQPSFPRPAQQDQRNSQHDQTQDDQRYPSGGIVDYDIHAKH